MPGRTHAIADRHRGSDDNGPNTLADAAIPPATLRIAHHEHVADGINNGHTIQVTYDEGDILTVGDRAYELVQYHFHTPSEHTFAGRRYPMEMHLVHESHRRVSRGGGGDD